ncbi:hypothetical protein K0U00_13715, partial [Paenibacillus sepulcri]|nr:hypothetical protein [Paenibacillus sepulcri]
GSVLFEIKDDGRGMDEEEVNRLLDHDRRPKGGIGLLNTNRRLTQRYGQGLKIQSRVEAGTTVSFVIPERGTEVR